MKSDEEDKNTLSFLLWLSMIWKIVNDEVDDVTTTEATDTPDDCLMCRNQSN